MKIGLLREIRTSENRILLTPDDASILINDGNELFIETDAGKDANFANEQYEHVGATILPSSEKVFRTTELILKVQPPLPVEYDLYQKKHLSFSSLLLKNSPDRAAALLKRESTFFALESFEDANGRRPILSSMSEIAGAMSIYQGCKYLEKNYGGKGIFLNGLGTVQSGTVTVLGAGSAAVSAIRTSLALKIKTNLVTRDRERLDLIRNTFQNELFNTFLYSESVLSELLPVTDLLVSAVFDPGQRSPLLVSKNQIKLMEKGSVIVDLSIDQGGCVETSRPTTYDNPIYEEEGIIHFCVVNMPSAVPYTASIALSKSVLPFIQIVVSKNSLKEIITDPRLQAGLYLYHGKIVNQELAQAINSQYFSVQELLELNL